MNDFRFTALSGGIPMGGSHYLLEVEGKRIAIDCGATQKGRKIEAPPIANGHIDALFLTHGHLDHVGMIPFFAQKHPETPIYGTKVTKRFARMILWDSYNIAFGRNNHGENVEVFFNTDDIQNAISHKRFRIVHRSEWFSPWPGWKVRFVSAGHINGAASIQIETPSGLKTLHSGDISIHDQATIKGAEITSDFRPDTIITEATYGDKEPWSRANSEKQFINHIARVIDRKGFVLIPAYGISGVNIALIAAQAGFKTYVDGMIRAASGIINFSNPWSDNDNPCVFPDNFIAVDFGNSKAHRREILAGEPAVIVSSHGMLEYGAVLDYASHVISDSKSAVFVPGYQAEETGGYKLLRLLRGQDFVMPDGKKVPVMCDVEKFHLSAHAPGRHIAEWVAEQNPWLAIVVHATKSGFEGLRHRIRERNPSIRVVPACNGETVEWN